MHAPLRHDSSTPHFLPQSPQFALSVCRFTHDAMDPPSGAQNVWFGEHEAGPLEPELSRPVNQASMPWTICHPVHTIFGETNARLNCSRKATLRHEPRPWPRSLAQDSAPRAYWKVPRACP